MRAPPTTIRTTTEMPRAKVFAGIRQIVGAGEIEFPAATVGELIAAASAAYGEEFAARVPHCTILVNGTGVAEDAYDTPITDGDEIAILPPVGGGAGQRWQERQK